MSEVSPGAGWWLASDGRWYAPELHPAVRQEATDVTSDSPPGYAAGQRTVTPHQPFSDLAGWPTGSDPVPPGGYPQQSYPQQSYPQQSYPQHSYPQQSYPQQSYLQPGTPGYGTPGYGTPGYGAPGYGAPGYQNYGYDGMLSAPQARRRHRRRGLLYGGGAVGVAVVLATLLIVTGIIPIGATGLTTGSSTIDIHWTSSSVASPAAATTPSTAAPGTSTFSGTAGGMRLQGTSNISPALKQDLGSLALGLIKTLPPEIPLYVYSGTLGGTPFSLTISIRSSDLQQSNSGTGDVTIHFDAVGTYGGKPVTGTATATGPTNGAIPPLHVVARIGSFTVTGVVTVNGSSPTSATGVVTVS